MEFHSLIKPYVHFLRQFSDRLACYHFFDLRINNAQQSFKDRQLTLMNLKISIILYESDKVRLIYELKSILLKAKIAPAIHQFYQIF